MTDSITAARALESNLGACTLARFDSFVADQAAALEHALTTTSVRALFARAEWRNLDANFTGMAAHASSRGRGGIPFREGAAQAFDITRGLLHRQLSRVPFLLSALRMLNYTLFVSVMLMMFYFIAEGTHTFWGYLFG